MMVKKSTPPIDSPRDHKSVPPGSANIALVFDSLPRRAWRKYCYRWPIVARVRSHKSLARCGSQAERLAFPISHFA